MQIPLFQPHQEVARLNEERARIIRAIYAPNTIASYTHDWLMFTRWCDIVGRQAIPATPETVSLYLTYLFDQGRKITTAARRNCAIAYEHRRQSFPSPIVRDVLELLRGAQRLRQEQPRQMRPLTIANIRDASQVLRKSGTRMAIRNRAVLILGFASALRRINLATLMLADLAFTDAGILLTIRHEKQDQEGKGRIVAIPPGKCPDTCPVACLKEWLAMRGNQAGPIFCRLLRHRTIEQPLHGDQIARIVRRAIAAAGGTTERIGGHSLRSGFITAALDAGVNEIVIANHTGHRSLDTLRRYYRPADPFQTNACSALDL